MGYNQVQNEKVAARWGNPQKLYSNKAESGYGPEARMAAYGIAVPEVGDRNTALAENVPYQGKSSPVFKLAQRDAVSRFALPLAAMLIGFFVGSAATLAIFRFARGTATA